MMITQELWISILSIETDLILSFPFFIPSINCMKNWHTLAEPIGVTMMEKSQSMID